MFKTSAEKAYDIISKKIISGELKPGEHLTRRRMAKLTGLSVIPVIEALHKLESEGLVISEPYYGTKVIEMNQQTIIDCFVLRMAVECQIARILALHKNTIHLEQLALLAKQLDSMSRTPDQLNEFWEKHYAFHLKMAKFAGHQSLVESLRKLNLFDILRRTIITYTEQKGFDSPPNHHVSLVEAIATGDREIAEKAMRNHVNFSGLATEDDF